MSNELSKLSGYYDRKTAHDMDYRGYMEKQAMVKDIGTAIQRSTEQQMIMTGVVGANITSRIDQSTERLEYSMVRMQTGIQTSIRAQTYTIVASHAALAHTFNQGFDRINNTLDMGFSGISNQLGAMTSAFSIGLSRIADNIKQMSKDICDRLDAIHDIVNNPLLTQSRELYRRSVLNYNKGFFEEAFEDIKTAIEKNKTDYISWFHAGKIFMFGASEFCNVINLDKAISAFTNAAKYISPDIAVNEDAQRMASEIWFYLGLAHYNKYNDLNFNKKETEAQAMITEARKAFEKSYSYSENMLESLYNIARCKIIMGNAEDAIKDIETVIAKDKGYAIKAVDENDFETITADIYSLIERMKKEIYPKAKADLDALKLKVADTVFIGGPFADMVKKLVEDNIPETFMEDIPYFDVRNGYEIFPVILDYLNMEEYPCDRLVAELLPKDCPYDIRFKEKGEHPSFRGNIESIFGKLYNQSLICWGMNWTDTNQNLEKIKQMKEKYRITDHGYPRLLTYKYTNIANPGIIEFMLPTDELLQKVRCNAPSTGNPFIPTKHYSDLYKSTLYAFDDIPEKANIDIADLLTLNHIDRSKASQSVNNNEYNCSQWRFMVKWDKTKPSSEQEFGIAYSKNEDFFVPLCSINVGSTNGGGYLIFYTPSVFFQNKETIIMFPNNFKNKNDPIKVFQPGIISKSVIEKAEQEKKKAEQEKAEQEAIEAEAERKAKAEQEAKEAEQRQRQQWMAQGLCKYCGGKLGGVFTKKCKSCGREN